MNWLVKDTPELMTEGSNWVYRACVMPPIRQHPGRNRPGLNFDLSSVNLRGPGVLHGGADADAARTGDEPGQLHVRILAVEHIGIDGHATLEQRGLDPHFLGRDVFGSNSCITVVPRHGIPASGL